LRGLPVLYDACGSALERTGRRDGPRVSGWWPAGISLNEAAMTARADIVEVLASWCSLVIDERGAARLAGHGAGEFAAFLSSHLPWLLDHVAAADFCEEIDELTTAARRAASAQPVLRIDLGECAEPGCRLPVSATGGTPVPRVSCQGGHTWQPHQWLQLGTRSGHVPAHGARPGHAARSGRSGRLAKVAA
jgi:hypothetical protein